MPSDLSILLCISSLITGGAERQVQLVAGGLVAQGVDLHIAYLAGSPVPSCLQRPGITLHPLPARSNHDPGLAWALVRLVRGLAPDCVLTMLPQMDVLGGIAAKVCGRPHILFERSSGDCYPVGLKTWLRQAVGKRAAGVLANSEGGSAYWAPSRPHDPPRLVPNCMDITGIEQSPIPDVRDHGLPEDAKIVLSVGRLSPEKNPAVVVRAMPLVLARHPGAHLVLFGNGPQEGLIRGMVESAGLGANIHLMGFSGAVWGWMRRADVLVAPSHFEGAPNVVLEAIAARAPLAVSDIPAHREILDESSACFFTPTAASEVAAAIDGVLSDPNSARKRATNAEAKLLGRGIDEVAREWISQIRIVAGIGVS